MEAGTERVTGVMKAFIVLVASARNPSSHYCHRLQLSSEQGVCVAVAVPVLSSAVICSAKTVYEPPPPL
jgi:hypothetical protein